MSRDGERTDNYVVVDPKDEDLAGFEGHRGVRRVATTIDDMRAAVADAVAELDARKAATGAARRAGAPPRVFVPLVVMVDEVQQAVALDGGDPRKSRLVADMGTVA